MTFHSDLLTLAAVQLLTAQPRGSPGTSSIWNIYSEHKLQGRCTEAPGTQLAMGKRHSWHGLCADPVFKAGGDFFSTEFCFLQRIFFCFRSTGWSLLERAGSFIRHFPQSHEMWGSDATDHLFLCSEKEVNVFKIHPPEAFPENCSPCLCLMKNSLVLHWSICRKQTGPLEHLQRANPNKWDYCQFVLIWITG